eukprot:292852-Prymnesium_polylepis.1
MLGPAQTTERCLAAHGATRSPPTICAHPWQHGGCRDCQGSGPQLSHSHLPCSNQCCRGAAQ